VPLQLHDCQSHTIPLFLADTDPREHEVNHNDSMASDTTEDDPVDDGDAGCCEVDWSIDQMATLFPARIEYEGDQDHAGSVNETPRSRLTRVEWEDQERRQAESYFEKQSSVLKTPKIRIMDETADLDVRSSIPPRSPEIVEVGGG